MLKRMSIRKITVTTFALLILFLFYFFPTTDNKIELEKTITYQEEENFKSIYFLDKYNYVSKVLLSLEEVKIYELVKEKIEYLKINGTKSDRVPNGFRALIPEETKILDLKLEKDVLSINFSKELLDISIEDEEKAIEALIFSLTDIDEINKIIIKVEGKALSELPNSKKALPEILDRSYGINKIYDFDSLSDITKTTVFYINDINDEIYYTPVTKVTNDNREKITIIIDELKSSLVYQSNLSSYLSAAAELKSFEIIENSMHLSFNDKIFSDFNTKSILEEVKYTISMSIKENYDVEEVVFIVNNEEIAETTLKTLE